MISRPNPTPYSACIFQWEHQQQKHPVAPLSQTTIAQGKFLYNVSAQRRARNRSSRRPRRTSMVGYLLCVLATMYCLVQAVPCSGAITHAMGRVWLRNPRGACEFRFHHSAPDASGGGVIIPGGVEGGRPVLLCVARRVRGLVALSRYRLSSFCCFYMKLALLDCIL